MNLHHRISEVKNHIDKLQQTANMHFKNKSMQKYKIVSETLNENKEQLKILYSDLEKQNRIISYRINHE